jgi:hypothetical protein
MRKTVWRLALFILLASLTSGCYVFGPFIVPVPASRGGPPGGASPTPTLPTIELEYAGTQVAGTQTFFNWRSSSGGYSGSSGVAPGTTPALSLPSGASLNIVVTLSTPATLWVVELDGHGVPANSTTLTPTSNVTPYTPSRSGAYQLQVTAQWAVENLVMTLFALNVTP